MIPFPWYDELEDHEDRLDPEFTRGKLRVIAFPSSSSVAGLLFSSSFTTSASIFSCLSPQEEQVAVAVAV